MQGRRHTLLVVDDEPDVLESLRHLFHRAYRVLTAEAGGPALELLGREDVHVILSDQRMPGMTGDAFLAQARLVRPDAVRMLFTGYADIQAVINAVNEGRIFRYILKPWDPLELEALVRQAVEQYELLAERNRLIVQLQEANDRLTRANQELAESGVLKSAFIEVASHEFNTPITLVLGLSELLRLLNPDREPREREVVDRIAGQRPPARQARGQHPDPDARRGLPPHPPPRAGRAGRPPQGRRRGSSRSSPPGAIGWSSTWPTTSATSSSTPPRSATRCSTCSPTPSSSPPTAARSRSRPA